MSDPINDPINQNAGQNQPAQPYGTGPVQPQQPQDPQMQNPQSPNPQTQNPQGWDPQMQNPQMQNPQQDWGSQIWGSQPYPNSQGPVNTYPNQQPPRKPHHGAWFAGGLVSGLLVGLLILFLITFVGPSKNSYSSGSGTTSSSQQSGLTVDEQKELVDKANQLVSMIDSSEYDDVSHEDLINGALHGLVDGTGDKYAAYYNQEEMADMSQQTEGNYVGIGVTVMLDTSGQGADVMSVNPNGPAYQQGLQTGDMIVGADGTSFDGMTLSEMVTYMRGEEGTDVTITYYRNGVKSDMTITRQKLTVTEVYATMLDQDHKVGYISLTGFDEVAADQFHTAVRDLASQGMTSLILDLRDNPGGLVNVGVSIADEFLDEGTVTYMLDKYGNRKDYYSSTDGNELNVKMYILINGNSASCSELISAALRDRYGAVLVGEQSYGKGIAQTVFPLSDGSGIKLTTNYFYTPNGENFHGKGLTPDIEVSLDDGVTLAKIKNADGIPDITQDAQLQKALDAALGK